jgi:hypothetical protein
MFRSMRELWDSARRKEMRDYIVFTYVAVDRLGVFKWRLRWRYDMTKDHWPAFRIYDGTHDAALNAAIKLNSEITEQLKRKGHPGSNGHFAARHDDRDIVHKGSWDECPACKRGKGGHPQ